VRIKFNILTLKDPTCLMNIEEFHAFCLSKKGVEETFPFDEHTLVFKVMGKVFAITGLDNEVFEVNLKCDPEYSVELREEYEAVRPGFHMNKKHWNTVIMDGSLPDQSVLTWIDDSYNLVMAGLPRKIRDELAKFD